MRPWRTTVVAVALAAALPLAGCSMVSQPDAAAWDQQAERSLSDAASQVDTARLALETAREERTWSSYTVVLVAQAEEAMGTAQDDLSRLQVPPARAQRAEEVASLLDEAATAVEDARAHAVAGRYDDERLRTRLSDLDRRLESEAGR